MSAAPGPQGGRQEGRWERRLWIAAYALIVVVLAAGAARRILALW
ncbi:hypothetical protein JOD31_003872 [Methylopila capsulata]|uniref:Uncharacterized protein n=1 Tax=Methylopila capsulata TaxID=61654 RepID=A0A9W6MSW2_9HYPH|nr:hypothetical protein [Methylopila capsulata]MBM7853611.1 hypothetical protein [Methylopila capsulata]GLK57175.1 hypothetical protein GCM10008170_31950 [Methylopila capsulata]